MIFRQYSLVYCASFKNLPGNTDNTVSITHHTFIAYTLETQDIRRQSLILYLEWNLLN